MHVTAIVWVTILSVIVGFFSMVGGYVAFRYDKPKSLVVALIAGAFVFIMIVPTIFAIVAAATA